MRVIRLLIVDDAPEVREGLRAILPLAGAQAGLALEVVGEAGHGAEAIARAADLAPDVVLMDLEMPVVDGYRATRAIKTRQATRVVALTVHDYPAARKRAEEAGADAFVEKGAPLETLIQAIGGHPAATSKGERP